MLCCGNVTYSRRAPGKTAVRAFPLSAFPCLARFLGPRHLFTSSVRNVDRRTKHFQRFLYPNFSIPWHLVLIDRLEAYETISLLLHSLRLRINTAALREPLPASLAPEGGKRPKPPIFSPLRYSITGKRDSFAASCGKTCELAR